MYRNICEDAWISESSHSLPKMSVGGISRRKEMEILCCCWFKSITTKDVSVWLLVCGPNGYQNGNVCKTEAKQHLEIFDVGVVTYSFFQWLDVFCHGSVAESSDSAATNIIRVLIGPLRTFHGYDSPICVSLFEEGDAVTVSDVSHAGLNSLDWSSVYCTSLAQKHLALGCLIFAVPITVISLVGAMSQMSAAAEPFSNLPESQPDSGPDWASGTLEGRRGWCCTALGCTISGGNCLEMCYWAGSLFSVTLGYRHSSSAQGPRVGGLEEKNFGRCAQASGWAQGASAQGAGRGAGGARAVQRACEDHALPAGAYGDGLAPSGPSALPKGHQGGVLCKTRQLVLWAFFYSDRDHGQRAFRWPWSFGWRAAVECIGRGSGPGAGRVAHRPAVAEAAWLYGQGPSVLAIHRGRLRGFATHGLPEGKELTKGPRSKRQRELYAKKVNEGPLDGCLKIKVPSCPSELELQYFLKVGTKSKGTISAQFRREHRQWLLMTSALIGWRNWSLMAVYWFVLSLSRRPSKDILKASRFPKASTGGTVCTVTLSVLPCCLVVL